MEELGRAFRAEGIAFICRLQGWGSWQAAEGRLAWLGVRAEQLKGLRQGYDELQAEGLGPARAGFGVWSAESCCPAHQAVHSLGLSILVPRCVVLHTELSPGRHVKGVPSSEWPVL